jgi:hypothetical protein
MPLHVSGVTRPSSEGSAQMLFGVTECVRWVAQFIEALRYKPEGRGIDSRRCHWNFSLT